MQELQVEIAPMLRNNKELLLEKFTLPDHRYIPEGVTDIAKAEYIAWLEDDNNIISMADSSARSRLVSRPLGSEIESTHSYNEPRGGRARNDIAIVSPSLPLIIHPSTVQSPHEVIVKKKGLGCSIQ